MEIPIKFEVGLFYFFDDFRILFGEIYSFWFKNLVLRCFGF